MMSPNDSNAIQGSALSLNQSKWQISQYYRLILIVLILASVLVRITYFIQINNSPNVWQHRWEESDMNFFDLWAREIATGDWLTNQALHPYHTWKKMVADIYFRMHPNQAKILEQQNQLSREDFDTGHALWNQWYGNKQFHQEPLYPYLIALTYKILGFDVRWVFAWQAILGTLSNVLIFLIARHYFNDLVATITGFCALLYSPLLFYEMVLLRTTLITFTGLALIYLVHIAIKRNNWRWYFGIGIAFGIALLVKSTFLLFEFGLILLLAYHQRKSFKNLVSLLLILGSGIIISLVPIMARNATVGVPLTSISSVNSITFIFSNTGDYQPGTHTFNIEHIPRIMGKTNGHFLPTVLETLKTHDSIQSYLKQLWKKFTLIWYWYEYPNNTNFYYYRLHASILAYLPLTFFIIAPLAIAGLLLTILRFHTLLPLFLLIGINLLTILLANEISRYRIPLVAVLLPFAGFTIYQLIDWVRTKKFIQVSITIVILVSLSLFTMRPLPDHLSLIRTQDYISAYKIHYIPLIQQAKENQDWHRVANILSESLRYEPNVLQQLDPSHSVKNKDESDLISWFVRVHYSYAQALQKIGEIESANVEFQRVLFLQQVLKK